MMAGMARQAGGQNGWSASFLLPTKDKLITRMSAMQKMQAAAGGKPLGPNGQPSPAQIEAMRVSSSIHTFWTKLTCQKAMPPEMMKKLRAAGPGGAQKMMQEMMGGGGAPGAGAPGGMDIGSMMKSMMGGAGGGGGMPNMAQMQGTSDILNATLADESRSYESYGWRRGWWNAWLVRYSKKSTKLTWQI
jgi:signal recognition particle subunit SRP54